MSDMKLAYWPGCVSAAASRPSCTARWRWWPTASASSWSSSTAPTAAAPGVIAEHNQELADTLNARTFALAQQTGLPMMNICSTCQGAQSECQQRLRDSEYRSHINETLAEEGLSYDPEGFSNKNFLWVLVEDYGLDRLSEQVTRPLGGLAGRPLLRLLHPPAQAPPRLRGASRAGPLPRPADRGARRRGRPVRRRAQVLRLPDHHDGARGLAAPGRHARRRRARRGRRLPGHPLPALPPQPRHAAARGRQGRQPRPRAGGAASPPARRPRARLRAQAARHDQAHRFDRVGRAAAASPYRARGSLRGREPTVERSGRACARGGDRGAQAAPDAGRGAAGAALRAPRSRAARAPAEQPERSSTRTRTPRSRTSWRRGTRPRR